MSPNVDTTAHDANAVDVPRTQPARTSPRPASEYHLSAVFSTLVAVADDAAAESAIRFTNILAREHGAVPTVLRVLDMSMYAAVDAMPSIIGVEAALLSPEYRDEVVAALEEQIRSVLGTPTRWRIEFETGDTGRCIARHAQQIRAELIVIGLRPHSTLRRAFVRDTVCDVIRGTTIPVLAVRPSLRGLPSRVMVAMDFSMASLRAAHLAREMIGYSGSMELVYVRSPGGQADVNARTWHNADGLEEALDRLIEDLHPTPDVQITSVIREGDAGTQLLTHAEQSQPQLVALGSEHQSIVDRFFNDSVSTTFAHDARWSLLMVPEHGE